MKARERVTKERELQLHERLLRADPTASSEIAELLVDYIVKVLRRFFPKQRHEDLYDEAAVRALMDYLQRPTAYDRNKSRLSSYLIRAAQADMKTLLARQARIHEYEKSLFVEDSEIDENKGIEVADPSMSEESIGSTIDVAFARDLIFKVVTDARSTSAAPSLLPTWAMPGPGWQK